MAERTYYAEVIHKVYDNTTGNHIEVGPDADCGPDLLEILQIEDGKQVARVVGSQEQLRLVAKAILALTGGE